MPASNERKMLSSNEALKELTGGSILDIAKECQTTMEKFKEVILVAGGKDCSTKIYMLC